MQRSVWIKGRKRLCITRDTTAEGAFEVQHYMKYPHAGLRSEVVGVTPGQLIERAQGLGAPATGVGEIFALLLLTIDSFAAAGRFDTGTGDPPFPLQQIPPSLWARCFTSSSFKITKSPTPYPGLRSHPLGRVAGEHRFQQTL